MVLLRGNAHFAAEAEFAAVCKPRGCVYINCSTVNQLRKALRGLRVFGDDRVGMVRGVRGDMGNRLVRAGNGLDGKNIIQKFRVEILFPRRCAGNDLLRSLVQTKLDGGRPAAARSSTRRFLSMGRNCPAISAWTIATSSALQTDGRLVLAFSMIFSALSKSASLSTYTWQMPVPVSMHGRSPIRRRRG